MLSYKEKRGLIGMLLAILGGVIFTFLPGVSVTFDAVASGLASTVLVTLFLVSAWYFSGGHKG
jgi:hypothetical protein